MAGLAQSNKKNNVDSLMDFTRAIELDPDYAWAMAQRGITYRDMERYEEALSDLARAIELDPDYAWRSLIEVLPIV